MQKQLNPSIFKTIGRVFSNRWVKVSIALFFYLLFTIWLNNYWWLIGVPIIFDSYVTKKVHWAFWKKKGVEKQPKLNDWIDSIIFAVVAAMLIRTFFIELYTIPTSSMEKSLLVGDYLFVSKYHYGPRKPITPVAVPFVHHTMPFTTKTKAFTDWIQWDYERMPGLQTIQRYDPVVFNFPEGDTVVVEHQNQSYYQIIRSEALAMQQEEKLKGISKPIKVYENIARKFIHQHFTINVRPVDKRENYIKRCVGLPGDTLQIIDGNLYINRQKQPDLESMQYKYTIHFKGARLNPQILKKLDISYEDINLSYRAPGVVVLPLTHKNAEAIKNLPLVDSVIRIINREDGSHYTFPHNPRYPWNEDNFGPIVVPKKGTTVVLSLENLPLYQRIISLYERHKLEVKENQIYIDNQLATQYTFAMDYYWMMGDSRHNSQDSRFWGFVPEDHIVGKAVFLWFSLDKDKSFPSNIRWNRVFKSIN